MLRMNRNPERVVEKVSISRVYRCTEARVSFETFERGNGKCVMDPVKAFDPQQLRIASYLVSSGHPRVALIKGLARCNRKGRLAFARFLDKVDSRISDEIIA